jgi:hypothetical protein
MSINIPQNAQNIVSSMGFSQEEWDLYRAAIAKIESQGSGGYSARGGSGDAYDGKYQLGSVAKQDAARIAGVRNPGDSSAGRQSFRDNPSQQEVFFAAYTKANLGYLSSNPRFVNASPEKKLEILGYAHNQGWSGADNYLNTGEVGADGFGTKGTKYTQGVAEEFRRAGRTPIKSEVQVKETASDPATGSKTDDNNPVPVPDKEIDVDNQFSQLSPEELDSEIESRRKEIDKLNEKAKSTWTQEEQERHKQLSAELNSLFQAKLADEDPDCIVRETAKGFTFKDTPDCEKFFSSVAMHKAFEKYRSERDMANPCGTSEMAKINTALQKFFVAIKGIKNYGDLYVNGTLNRIENVTALIRSTSEIIGAVLKTLVNRLRDFLLDKIRRGIEDLIDILLPTIAKAIKNTVIQAIVDNIFCSFKDIIKNLANIAGDFLFELIGKIVNVPFCAAQQFTNALVNNVAAIVDKSVGPLLDEINDVLGGVTSIVGNVFQALDYILGFEAFLCAKPNCPEIKKFKASPWGGPSKAEIDAFENFLAPLGGRQSPTAEGVIGSVDNFISDLEIFGGRVGDANQSPSSITTCDTDAFVCGPPKVEIFGGGGVGAVGQAIVDNIGRTIGVDLVFGGSGYTSPPFVSFVDSCEDTFTSGYAEIEDGKVVNVVMTTTPPAPPRDGRTEFDPPSEESTPDGNDYIVCLSGFRILNTGVGYTPNDSIQITPDIPGLVGGVQMTEVGQIFSIQLNEPVCGISEYPDITINSPTGEGAIIQPILSFTRVEETPDGDPNVVVDQPLTTLRGRSVLAEADFTRKDIVRIVNCVS